MAHFTWKDSYSVGIAEFDTQHKVIVDIINEIYAAMSSGTNRFLVIEEMDKLFEYADTHFAKEEKVLTAAGYPKLNLQKEAHQFYIDKIVKLKENISKGDLLTLLKLVDFLKDWLIDHILGMDKEYTEYLNSKGIS
jgi:hemerythrin-like metal-binding protein